VREHTTDLRIEDLLDEVTEVVSRPFRPWAGPRIGARTNARDRPIAREIALCHRVRDRGVAGSKRSR